MIIRETQKYNLMMVEWSGEKKTWKIINYDGIVWWQFWSEGIPTSVARFRLIVLVVYLKKHIKSLPLTVNSSLFMRMLEQRK